MKRTDEDHPAHAPEADPRFRATDDDGDAGGQAQGDEALAAPADGTAPAKKRRRRRRKPGDASRTEGGAGGGGEASD